MTLLGACPWDGWTPATIHFCEENICSWVTQPANAWSSMGFVLVGLHLRVLAARRGSQALKLFGPISIAVGLTSFAYHASYTFFFQVFDLASMYCFSALLLVMNARRLRLIRTEQVATIYWALVGVTTLLLLVFRVIGIPLFASHLIAVVLLERRASKLVRVDYFWFAFALAIFGAAFGFWILDFSRLWCDPDRHWVQGHAVWHLLNALALWAVYQFYTQFRNELA